MYSITLESLRAMSSQRCPIACLIKNSAKSRVPYNMERILLRDSAGTEWQYVKQWETNVSIALLSGYSP